MRSSLVDGKLVEPTSTLAAQLRHQQLVYEISKMVGDPRAAGCLGWLRREERLLAEWMVVRGVHPLPPRERSAPISAEEDYAEFWRE